jgi:soluble lytic murein transglycosylase-like protein
MLFPRRRLAGGLADLAATNGLSEDSHVVLGSTIDIPSGDVAAAPPPPAGAYTVRPGDTLSGIAARAELNAGQVAAMNGLAPDAHVISGTALKLPATSAPVAAPSPAPTTAPAAAPQAAGGSVNAAQIGQIASDHGVPPSLAAAIAWQESGFNNNVVSSANARGVMQILPGTWSWVEDNIARRSIDPASPQENVHVGVMYLNRLIRDAGGDVGRGVAGYYQGPASVARNGLLPETQRYVENVTALRSRFGGG